MKQGFPKKANQHQRLVMLDFDGTLFRSWEAVPDWWVGTPGDTGPWSFFASPLSLGPPCVPEKPGNQYWVQSVLREAREASQDPLTYVALITGREKAVKDRVLSLVASQGIHLDAAVFNPGLTPVQFKVAALRRLVSVLPDLRLVEVWENENHHAYARALLNMSETHRGRFRVKVHEVHTTPIPLITPTRADLGLTEEEKMGSPLSLMRDYGSDKFASHDDIPDILPFDPPKYFNGGIKCPLRYIKPTRVVNSEVEKAKEAMWKAYSKHGPRRQPISVRSTGGGYYEIVDGNSTYAVALASKWPSIQIEVVQNPLLKRGSGTNSDVGLYIPLPDTLAGNFPYKEYDPSPAHITFLRVGEVPKERTAEFVDVVKRFFIKERAPVLARLTGLDYFSGPNRRVAFVGATFSTDMGAMRNRLSSCLEDAGFVVNDPYPLAFIPHVTLAFSEDPSFKWTGPVPTGRWDFDSLQIWGLAETVDVSIGL